ncbi:uncharacterized protein LOC127715250 [Mytilus californianus]|uniref:uncharacterized protein LOC127715250 n=1 Tax=Mytilus californianus TaxID=6549 RepID=UPI002245C163|nr:uncharacterized protein LOC127715250 [Mytilus californianus]
MGSTNNNTTNTKCYRSMRKNEHPHKVNITVRKDEKSISDSKCACVIFIFYVLHKCMIYITTKYFFSGTCSHVVRLVHTIAHYQNLNSKEVPAELSSTSLPQQWHKPRGKKNQTSACCLNDTCRPSKTTSRKEEKTNLHPQKKERITASIFSKVAKRKRDIKETFLNSISNKKQFTLASTSYGIANEIKAKEKYAGKCGNSHLHACGLVSNPSFSFLGATPGPSCSKVSLG